MRSYCTVLKYSYPLANKVAMCYAQRQLGRVGIACVLFFAICLGTAIFNGFDLGIFESMGLAVAGCLMIYFTLRYQTWRRWKDKLESMGKPEAQLVVTDESFAVSSGAGSSTIPWKRFTDLWKHHEFWLLIMDKYSAPITIPLEGTNPEVLKLISEKISEVKKSKSH